MEENGEEGIAKLVDAIQRDLCDEFPDGFPFKGQQVGPENVIRDLAGLLGEGAANATRTAIRAHGRIHFFPQGPPMPPREDDIAKLVDAIQGYLVALYKCGLVYSGRQEIPENERNDLAIELAQRVAEVCRKAIRNNTQISISRRPH